MASSTEMRQVGHPGIVIQEDRNLEVPRRPQRGNPLVNMMHDADVDINVVRILVHDKAQFRVH